ncbi:hypothetical protein KIL84_018981 [Mauremys mutica]|uniref:Uncharacterized protein n=1 Tax=Mauremys mutica TaxID=74926 RepID=A0A9D3XUF0_9SAUR|nr:hypothetical protein KIL84_018981 [Mauremys mutica]
MYITSEFGTHYLETNIPSTDKLNPLPHKRYHYASVQLPLHKPHFIISILPKRYESSASTRQSSFVSEQRDRRKASPKPEALIDITGSPFSQQHLSRDKECPALSKSPCF